MPRISGGIWEGRFLTSQEFLRAIELVHDNATKERDTAGEQSETWFQKASRVYTLAMQEVSQTDPAFDQECQRMAQRIYKGESCSEEGRRGEGKGKRTGRDSHTRCGERTSPLCLGRYHNGQRN
jgi:hypothetical protein